MRERPIDATFRTQFLVEALPYIRAFQGKTIVIRYDGNAGSYRAIKKGFARDVALLQLVGINPVVVHEGDLQHGQEIVALINEHGGRAVGLSGRDGCLIAAQKSLGQSAGGVRPGDGEGAPAGKIERIEPELIRLLQSRAFIPVVTCFGIGRGGEPVALDPDAVAAELAQALEAEKLVLMTHEAGVLDKNGTLFANLTPAEIDTKVAEGAIHCGWPPKLDAALRAVRHGVKSAHVINGRVPSALLIELLTGEGLGTMIRSDAGPHFLPDSRRYLAA